jgi:hypothetical protein
MPFVLLLLALLLGRLERWLEQDAPAPLPPRPERGRWRRPSRAGRNAAAVEVGAGRRLLAHRARAAARRRPAVTVPTASVLRSERRHVLRGRLRSGR